MVADLGGNPVTGTETTTPTLSATDLDAFCEQMGQLPHWQRVAVALMYHCGLRVGETTKLAWSDLMYQHLPLNQVQLTGPMCKNGHGRTVPINGRLATLLVDCWEDHARPSDIPPSGYATAKSRNVGPTSTRQLERVVHDIGLDLGYPKLTPHVLRHTFATRLLSASNVVTVQQALGHQRLSTTQRYLHPSADEMRNAVEEM